MQLLTEYERYFCETREQIHLKIKGNKGEFIVLHDLGKNRKTVIHHSILQDNDFEINDGLLSVPKETYKCWFHNPGVHDEINEKRAERMEIIKDNILLLLKHKNEILDSPRFRNILASDDFYASPIGMDKNKVITIGELLQIWDREADFSTKCECGGKAYVYQFGGSVYSSESQKSFWCSNCGRWFTVGIIKESYKGAAHVRSKYKCTEYIIYELNVLKQMIRKFQRKEMLTSKIL